MTTLKIEINLSDDYLKQPWNIVKHEVERQAWNAALDAIGRKMDKGEE